MFEVVNDREIRRAGTFWIVSGGGGRRRSEGYLRHLLFRPRPFALFVTPVLGEFGLFALPLASRGLGHAKTHQGGLIEPCTFLENARDNGAMDGDNGDMHISISNVRPPCGPSNVTVRTPAGPALNPSHLAYMPKTALEGS